jgi:hypothetical protein
MRGKDGKFWLGCLFAATGMTTSLLAFPHQEGHPEPVVDPPRTQGPWSAFAYVGQYSDTAFLAVARGRTDFQSSWVGVFGVTKELGHPIPPVRLEGEAQLGQHWGKQSHQEINALLTSRWMPFPWDEFLPTTVAFGGGFSYALERPAIEARRDGPGDRLLVYLLLELELARPLHRDPSLFFRIHHRSGAYGTVGDGRATNFLGLGLRSRF